MSDPVVLTLNPDLDPGEFAEIYKQQGWVQIPNILPDGAARAVLQVLSQSTPWRLAFPVKPAAPGQPETVSYIDQKQAQTLGQTVLMEKIRQVEQAATGNYGFLYNVYPMIEAYTKGWDPGHPLHTLTEFLNSREFLDFGKSVIGCQSEITKADAQATLYARGHFLTRHVDEGYDQERRAAYTFGFTPRWEPDWGGLLAFLDEDLNIEKALLPRFNTLTLFDGRKIHSVTPVSNFAGGHRLQITGWLRDDPAHATLN